MTPLPRLAPPADVFIADPVIHAFNFAESNIASRYGRGMWEMAHPIHAGFNPPEVVQAPELYISDTPIEAAVATAFLEAQTTIGATHTLTLHSWFRDGLCSEAKTAEAARRWPDRVLAYVGIDPTMGIAQALDDLERQMAATPNAVGMKLYPHQMDPYRRWHADDPDILKLFARGQELGIRTVAIHKALPNGAVPLAPYKVDDLDIAPDVFPGLSFEIVHAGMAFLEETVWAVARYPNVYANLETTMAMLFRAPAIFADTLATFLFWAGPHKLIYSSGTVLTHPQPLIETFWAYELPAATLERFRVPQIGEAEKRMILGLNYARAVGLDPGAAMARVADDGFARAVRANGGLFAPYAAWRGEVVVPT